MPRTTSAIQDLVYYQSQRAEWGKSGQDLAECPALVLNPVEIGVVCWIKSDTSLDKCKYQEKYLMSKQISSYPPQSPKEFGS